MTYLGDFAEDETTVEIWFTTHDKSGGAIAPSTSIDLPDFKIYKDGGTSQKTATDGLTVSSPFDTLVGLHLLVLDTSNDTNDSGFWVTGSDYIVVLDPSDETVDSETVIAVIGQFSIENRFGVAVINDWTNGGRLDNLLDAIPTTAMRGTENAALASQITASGPTKGEMDTAHALLATPAQVATELGTYDGPTEAEMDTGHGLLATEAKQDIIDTVVDAIKVVTDKFLFTVANLVNSNVKAISDDTTAADNLEALMDGVLVITVNDGSATTTAFATDGFTEATDDHFNGRLMTFITGDLVFQQTDITDYDAAGGAQGSQEFTVTLLTSAPANNVIAIVH